MTTTRIVVIGCLTAYLHRNLLLMSWLLSESIALLVGIDVSSSTKEFDLYQESSHILLGSVFYLVILPYIFTHNFFKAASLHIVLFCVLVIIINADQSDFDYMRRLIQTAVGTLFAIIVTKIAIKLHGKTAPVSVYYQWWYINRPKDWLHVLWSLILSPVLISYLYLLHPSRVERTFILDYPAPLVLSVLSLSIVSPFVEELIFRRLFFSSLRQQASLFKATLISSLIFSLYHLDPVRLVPAFVAGVALALIYERTQSLIVCTAVHGCMNALIFLSIDIFAGGLGP